MDKPRSFFGTRKEWRYYKLCEKIASRKLQKEIREENNEMFKTIIMVIKSFF